MGKRRKKAKKIILSGVNAARLFKKGLLFLEVKIKRRKRCR